MEGARAREAKCSARGKRSVHAAKGPGTRARGATVRTRGEGWTRGASTGATRDSDARESVRPKMAVPAKRALSPKASLPNSPPQSSHSRPAVAGRRGLQLDLGVDFQALIIVRWVRTGMVSLAQDKRRSIENVLPILGS